MPSPSSPETIVARFLQSNNYSATLSSFLTEAGLPPDAGDSSPGALTLERILEEKKLFDQALAYEKISDLPSNDEWRTPAPSEPKILNVQQASNVLCVSIDRLEDADDVLSITMADRRLLQANASGDMDEMKTVLTQDSPILSLLATPSGTQFIGTTMSGKVFIHTPFPSELIETLIEAKDHTRYCVKAALFTTPDEDYRDWLLATIGWDSRLNLYRLDTDYTPGRIQKIRNITGVFSTLELKSTPEDILFLAPSPNRPEPILVLSRRDSSLLYYYAATATTPKLLGTQNLAPHALSWNIFTPSSIALCPTDSTLLAVATSSVPHMKVLFVRLLIPSGDAAASTASAADDPRAKLAEADKHEAAILHHVSTLAPQTAYSTPRVVWRPDGSGVWVNSDDGCIRGIERGSGKVVTTLKGGHEIAKIRTLWAGMVKGEEVVVSGGFDRRVVVWRVKDGETL